MQTVKFNGIAQGLRNDLLSGHFLKGLRPPFSCNYLICHRSECGFEFRRLRAEAQFCPPLFSSKKREQNGLAWCIMSRPIHLDEVRRKTMSVIPEQNEE